jgi:hypothetical protein
MAAFIRKSQPAVASPHSPGSSVGGLSSADLLHFGGKNKSAAGVCGNESYLESFP